MSYLSDRLNVVKENKSTSQKSGINGFIKSNPPLNPQVQHAQGYLIVLGSFLAKKSSKKYNLKIYLPVKLNKKNCAVT